MINFQSKLISPIGQDSPANNGRFFQLNFQTSANALLTYQNHIYGLYCLLLRFGEEQHKKNMIEKTNRYLEKLKLENQEKNNQLQYQKQKIKNKLLRTKNPRKITRALQFILKQLDQKNENGGQWEMHNDWEMNIIQQAILHLIKNEQDLLFPKRLNFAEFVALSGKLINIDYTIVSLGTRKIIQYFSPQFQESNVEVFVEYNREDQTCTYVKRQRNNEQKTIFEQYAQLQKSYVNQSLKQSSQKYHQHEQFFDLLDVAVSQVDEYVSFDDFFDESDNYQKQGVKNQEQQSCEQSSVKQPSIQSDQVQDFQGAFQGNFCQIKISNQSFMTKHSLNTQRQMNQRQFNQGACMLSRLFSISFSEKQQNRITSFFRHIKMNILQQKIDICWFFNEINKITESDLLQQILEHGKQLSEGEQRVKQFIQIIYQINKQHNKNSDGLQQFKNIFYIVLYLFLQKPIQVEANNMSNIGQIILSSLSLQQFQDLHRDKKECDKSRFLKQILNQPFLGLNLIQNEPIQQSKPKVQDRIVLECCYQILWSASSNSLQNGESRLPPIKYRFIR